MNIGSGNYVVSRIAFLNVAWVVSGLDHLEGLADANRNRSPFPSDGKVNPIVDVVFLVEIESEPSSRRRQQLV